MPSRAWGTLVMGSGPQVRFRPLKISWKRLVPEFCFFFKSRNGYCTRWTSQKTHIQGLNPFWESKLLQTGSLLISELIPHASFPSTAIFRGLALAAVGFRHHMALARLALAVPFVLLVLQLRRPDSPEMLALRLQQETH